MKQTFTQWVRELTNKGYLIESVKGPPPFPMFFDDGTPVKEINLKWVCLMTGDEYIMEYDSLTVND